MAKLPLPLKTVLLLLIAGCLGLSVIALAAVRAGRLLPLAWGLWRRHPLARRVALAVLWLLALVLPVGVINPFAAMDGAVGGPVWALALPVYGGVAVALGMIHVLGRYQAAYDCHDAA